MGASKRPKLRVGQSARGAEFYYYRRPSCLKAIKQSLDEEAATETANVTRIAQAKKATRARKERKAE